jgi:hypothetical protein
MARYVRATTRSRTSEQSFLHCSRSLQDQASSYYSQNALSRLTRRISTPSACLAFSSRLVYSFTSCVAFSTAKALNSLPYGWSDSSIYTRHNSSDGQRAAWAVLLARRAPHTSSTRRCSPLGSSLRSSDSRHLRKRRRCRHQRRKRLRRNNETEIRPSAKIIAALI